VNHNNNLYITDTRNHVIRKIDAAGNASTLAGTGQPDIKTVQVRKLNSIDPQT
jgi:hypothetical protein